MNLASVLKVGVEPTPLMGHGSKPCASTNSATSASYLFYQFFNSSQPRQEVKFRRVPWHTINLLLLDSHFQIVHQKIPESPGFFENPTVTPVRETIGSKAKLYTFL